MPRIPEIPGIPEIPRKPEVPHDWPRDDWLRLPEPPLQPPRGPHEAVLRVLRCRFGELPADLVESVEAVDDMERLRRLAERAMAVASTDEFRQALAS